MSNPDQFQGLAAYLRAEAKSVAWHQPNAKTLNDWAAAVDRTEAAAMAATVPASPHRPSPEWYATMIQSTADDDFQVGPAFVAAPKDHEIAALVNRVRDVAIEFHGAQQLRVRIAEIIVPALKALQAPVAGQPAEPSPASYSSVERIMKLQEDCDALRTALEVIALGNAEDPVRDAGDTLVDLGHWRADALAQHRAELRAAPKGDSNG